MAYIEREALKQSIKIMPRTTNPALVLYSSVQKIISNAPAADVVEVVHCKNCKYFEKFQAGHFCNKFGGIVTKEDYCSRGERMANNGNQNP